MEEQKPDPCCKHCGDFLGEGEGEGGDECEGDD